VIWQKSGLKEKTNKQKVNEMSNIRGFQLVD